MSRPPAKPAKTVPMCCVSIDFNSYLLPASVGMKLVEILQQAYKCHENFGERDYQYTPEVNQPRVELKLVRANQVLPPRDSNSEVLRLER